MDQLNIPHLCVYSVWEPKLHLIVLLQKQGCSSHKGCAVINGCVSILIVKTPPETLPLKPPLSPSIGRWHLINPKQSYWETNFNYKTFAAYSIDRREQRPSISLNFCAK